MAKGSGSTKYQGASSASAAKTTAPVSGGGNSSVSKTVEELHLHLNLVEKNGKVKGNISTMTPKEISKEIDRINNVRNRLSSDERYEQTLNIKLANRKSEVYNEMGHTIDMLTEEYIKKVTQQKNTNG